MRKEKEKIRTQITKSLEVYKNKNGFTFFELNKFDFEPYSFKLDNNDIEVLFMELNESDFILLTTKSLFIRQKNVETKIDGTEIDSFYFDNLKKEKNKKTEFDNLTNFKSWLYSGDFRITTKDRNEKVVNLPHHDFGFCLFNAIKKLKFVTNKYVGI